MTEHLHHRFAILVAGEHHAVVYEREWRGEAENLARRCAGFASAVLVRDQGQDGAIILEWRDGQPVAQPAPKWR